MQHARVPEDIRKTITPTTLPVIARADLVPSLRWLFCIDVGDGVLVKDRLSFDSVSEGNRDKEDSEIDDGTILVEVDANPLPVDMLCVDVASVAVPIIVEELPPTNSSSVLEIEVSFTNASGLGRTYV